MRVELSHQDSRAFYQKPYCNWLNSFTSSNQRNTLEHVSCLLVFLQQRVFYRNTREYCDSGDCHWASRCSWVTRTVFEILCTHIAPSLPEQHCFSCPPRAAACQGMPCLWSCCAHSLLLWLILIGHVCYDILLLSAIPTLTANMAEALRMSLEATGNMSHWAARFPKRKVLVGLKRAWMPGSSGNWKQLWRLKHGDKCALVCRWPHILHSHMWLHILYKKLIRTIYNPKQSSTAILKTWAMYQSDQESHMIFNSRHRYRDLSLVQKSSFSQLLLNHTITALENCRMSS